MIQDIELGMYHDIDFGMGVVSLHSHLRLIERVVRTSHLDQDMWDRGGYLDNAEASRSTGTCGHQATLKLVHSELQRHENYYDLQEQHFTFAKRVSTLAIKGPGTGHAWKELQVTPINGRLSRNITAALVVVDNSGCNPSDYSDTMKGSIAMLPQSASNQCSFATKTRLAEEAGAVGVLGYSSYYKLPLHSKRTFPTSGDLDIDGSLPVARLDFYTEAYPIVSDALKGNYLASFNMTVYNIQT
jgi:hypothetical protein